MSHYLGDFVATHTSRIIDDSERSLRFPKYILWIMLYISYNVVLQGVADIFLKIGSYTSLLPEFILRLDFLFLTAISVLMGYQTLIGLRRRELDVTRNSILLGLLVEAGLVISDIVHVIEYAGSGHVFAIRMPFIVLTTINFFLLIYIAKRLRLFYDDKERFTLV